MYAPANWLVTENEYEAPEVTPRRRRTGCCEFLRMDGQPTSYEQMGAAGITLNNATTGLTGPIKQHVWTCPAGRPTVSMDPMWVVDICTSSWQKGCLYRPEQEAPLVFYTIGTPEVDVRQLPPIIPPTILPRLDLPEIADRIRLSLSCLGLTYTDASVGMGLGKAYVSNALGSLQVTQLQRIDKWVKTRQGERAA